MSREIISRTADALWLTEHPPLEIGVKVRQRIEIHLEGWTEDGLAQITSKAERREVINPDHLEPFARACAHLLHDGPAEEIFPLWIEVSTREECARRGLTVSEVIGPINQEIVEGVARLLNGLIVVGLGQEETGTKMAAGGLQAAIEEIYRMT